MTYGKVAAALLLLFALAGLLFLYSHPFVSMTNDHQGRSAFPTPGPADSRIVGGVRLGNAGLLPYMYQVHVQDPLPSGTTLQVVRMEDGSVLFSGRLAQTSVGLGRLEPSQRVTLKLVLTEPPGSRYAPTLVWSARAVAPDFGAVAVWPPAAWIAIGGLVGLDLLLVVAWAREVRRGRLLGVRFP